MTMDGHNLEKESLLSPTDPLEDPDIEAILDVVYGLFVPIITFVVQILNDRQRDTRGDARVIQIQIHTIRRAMNRAQSVLDELDKLAKTSNLLLEPIWPVGHHGVSMTGEEQARYIELINIIGEAFKDIDNACILLLSFSLLKKKTTALEIEINRLQSILDKVHISKTYGEKLRYMRWSINICHNILKGLE
jgi:hypothetical protein